MIFCSRLIWLTIKNLRKEMRSTMIWRTLFEICILKGTNILKLACLHSLLAAVNASLFCSSSHREIERAIPYRNQSSI